MLPEQFFDQTRRAIEQSNITDFANFGEGRDEHWIVDAESMLGIAFPPSYRWWLRMYGGGEVNGCEIYSVYDVPMFAGDGDVARIHRANVAKGAASDQLVVCKPDGHEVFYLLLSQRDSDGEAPVISFDRINDVHALYASNFAGFLIRFIREQS
jgi:antitoxin YobK